MCVGTGLADSPSPSCSCKIQVSTSLSNSTSRWYLGFRRYLLKHFFMHAFPRSPARPHCGSDCAALWVLRPAFRSSTALGATGHGGAKRSLFLPLKRRTRGQRRKQQLVVESVSKSGCFRIRSAGSQNWRALWHGAVLGKFTQPPPSVMPQPRGSVPGNPGGGWDLRPLDALGLWLRKTRPLAVAAPSPSRKRVEPVGITLKRNEKKMPEFSWLLRSTREGALEKQR